MMCNHKMGQSFSFTTGEVRMIELTHKNVQQSRWDIPRRHSKSHALMQFMSYFICNTSQHSMWHGIDEKYLSATVIHVWIF